MHKLIMTGMAALALLVGPALGQTAAPPAAANSAPSTGLAPKTSPAKPAGQGQGVAKPGAAQLLDINSATKEQLQVLKGVGPVRAEAIIKGRPYRGKDELARKKILPQNVYDDVQDKVIARQH